MSELTNKAPDPQGFYDLAPCAFFTLNRDCRICGVNHKGILVLDGEELELINASFRQFIARDSLVTFDNFFRKIFNTGLRQSCEVELQSGDDRSIIANLDGIVSDNANYCLVTATDITERKKKREEISIDAERLKLATRAGGFGIWDWDMIHNILVWDDQVYKLYGITRDTYGSPYEAWLRGLHPDDSAKRDDAARMALRGRNEFGSEFRVCWPDGSIHHLRSLSIIQRNDEGKPVRMIGINWDISEQKAREEAILTAKEEAVAANKSKSDFLANISHEIRTPLNAILGFSELLNASISDPVQKAYLDSIKFSGRNLLTIVTDIIDLARLESGKIRLEYDYVESDSFFKEFGKIFEFQISEKKLSYVTDISADLPEFIYIDGARLRQIILNIIGNAVKFTEKGDIRLKIYPKNHDVIVYSQDRQEEVIDLVIQVKDTGIGIPAGRQTEIFEALFNQGGGGEKGGAGLGLPIAKRLTRLMHGYIRLKSSVGEGSTFIVTIPGIPYRKVNTSLNVDLNVDLRNVSFEKATIIVADDIQDNCKYYKEILLSEDLTILEAANGLEALELVRISHPDLVIADIIMPVLDGYGLVSKMKHDENLEHIPVVACSAPVTAEIRDKILANRFAGLLIKPVTKEALFVELMRHLKYRKMDRIVSPSMQREGTAGDIIEDLTGLISALENEYLLKWKHFESRQPLGEVRIFADSLKGLGIKHNCRLIESYGKELSEAAGSFNIDRMIRLLGRYGEMIRQLRS